MNKKMFKLSHRFFDKRQIKNLQNGIFARQNFKKTTTERKGKINNGMN